MVGGVGVGPPPPQVVLQHCCWPLHCPAQSTVLPSRQIEAGDGSHLAQRYVTTAVVGGEVGVGVGGGVGFGLIVGGRVVGDVVGPGVGAGVGDGVGGRVVGDGVGEGVGAGVGGGVVGAGVGVGGGVVPGTQDPASPLAETVMVATFVLRLMLWTLTTRLVSGML